jgi:hypothetical protein
MSKNENPAETAQLIADGYLIDPTCTCGGTGWMPCPHNVPDAQYPDRCHDCSEPLDEKGPGLPCWGGGC